jgi:hypothetical protein
MSQNDNKISVGRCTTVRFQNVITSLFYILPS